jgi:hypothetical protein
MAAVVVLLQELHTNVDCLAFAVEISVRPGCRRCWRGAVDIGRAVVGLAAECVPQMRRFALPHSGDIVGLNRNHSQKAKVAFFARLRLVSEAKVARPKHSCAALLHSHCPRQASEAVEEVCLYLYWASRQGFHCLGAAWEAAVAAQDHRWPVGAAAVLLAVAIVAAGPCSPMVAPLQRPAGDS